MSNVAAQGLFLFRNSYILLFISLTLTVPCKPSSIGFHWILGTFLVPTWLGFQAIYEVTSKCDLSRLHVTDWLISGIT